MTIHKSTRGKTQRKLTGDLFDLRFDYDFFLPRTQTRELLQIERAHVGMVVERRFRIFVKPLDVRLAQVRGAGGAQLQDRLIW